MESLSKTSKYKSFTERTINKSPRLLIYQKKIKEQKNNKIIINNKQCFNKSSDFFQTSLTKNISSLNSSETVSKKKIRKEIIPNFFDFLFLFLFFPFFEYKIYQIVLPQKHLEEF